MLYKWEKTIETRSCKNSSVEFAITDKDIEFYEKISPVFGWKKYHIPLPTLSPDSRQQRRISYRNFWHLYNDTCALTGKKIVSMYHNPPFPVYDNMVWWWDSWDAMDYGVEIDFEKPFFDQYKSLSDTVPCVATMNVGSEDSTYSNFDLISKSEKIPSISIPEIGKISRMIWALMEQTQHIVSNLLLWPIHKIQHLCIAV